ncbi:MAG: HD domain-containing phosphohydrolase [Longimicrobiaceae bacterium]
MTQPSRPAFPQHRERPRVLVVDDEPNIRLVLRRALSEEEYQVEEASDGRAALKRFRRSGADVILSDLLMPGVDGLEFLKQVKEIDDTVGFVILTGAGTLENAVEALRLHADDYLLKPFNLDEVSLAVERALERQRLVRENRYYQEHLEHRVAEQAERIERIFVEALHTLANAIEARDGYTGGHVERVTRYAVATGREMGLKGERLRTLWVGALLHDVGKIGVPDEILRKPGRLTEDEYEVMKRHPQIGASIVERSSFLEPALPAVLHHQERWDGTGYPNGLSGEEISVEGRILSVADTFDAIVTARPYRDERSQDDAVEELRRCSGSQFDPQVVQAFIDAKQKGFPGDGGVPVLLGNGGTTGEHLLREPPS